MRTVDSNLWGGASGHTYTMTRLPDGTTAIDAVVICDGKNLTGRLVGGLLGSVAKGGPGQGLPAHRVADRGAERGGPVLVT